MANLTSAPPAVSVVMPVWNGARFCDEAIESVLAQDFADFEFIIVDDGSSDDTPAILARWADRDPRIRLFSNATRRGISASLNRGLGEARGKYIARQDADDVSLPARFRLEVAALESDPRIPLVSMSYQFMDDRGVVLRTERRDQPPEIVEFLLQYTNPLGGHSQVMFRTDRVREAGGYDETYPRVEDYELWSRLAALGPIAILPQVGLRYRLHASQTTLQPRDPEQIARAMSIPRRMMAGYLGRAISEEEASAASGAWRRGRAFDVALAGRLLREAHAVFRSRHRDRPALSKRLKRIIGGRLGVTSMLLLKNRKPGMAAACFRLALGWNPIAAFMEPLHVLAQSGTVRLRKRFGKRKRTGR